MASINFLKRTTETSPHLNKSISSFISEVAWLVIAVFDKAFPMSNQEPLQEEAIPDSQSAKLSNVDISVFSSNFPTIKNFNFTEFQKQTLNTLNIDYFSRLKISGFILEDDYRVAFIKLFWDVSLLEFIIISFKFQAYANSLSCDECEAQSWCDNLQNVVVFISGLYSHNWPKLQEKLTLFFSDSQDFSRFLSSASDFYIKNKW